MDDREPIPEIPLRMAPETSKARALIEGTFGHREAGDRHKLGGNPDWLQGDETPGCPECGEPMEFYGQLDHLGSVEELKDEGNMAIHLTGAAGRSFDGRIVLLVAPPGEPGRWARQQ